MILWLWLKMFGCKHNYMFLKIRKERHMFNIIKSHKYEICTKCDKIRDIELL